MTEACFARQMGRLKLHFGEKAFSGEFQKLVAEDVRSVPNEFFEAQVSRWILTRRHHDSPMGTEFHELKLAWEKSQLRGETKGAARAIKSAWTDLWAHLEGETRDLETQGGKRWRK